MVRFSICLTQRREGAKKKEYLTQRHKEGAPGLRRRPVAAGDPIKMRFAGFFAAPMARAALFVSLCEVLFFPSSSRLRAFA
jgi:hypothetical protein